MHAHTVSSLPLFYLIFPLNIHPNPRRRELRHFWPHLIPLKRVNCIEYSMKIHSLVCKMSTKYNDITKVRFKVEIHVLCSIQNEKWLVFAPGKIIIIDILSISTLGDSNVPYMYIYIGKWRGARGLETLRKITKMILRHADFKVVYIY